ncbi:metal-dependent phosphohydrolase [Methylobacterium sp. D53M]
MPDRLVLPPLRRSAFDAATFAGIVHEGQFDKAGKPYVEHLARVAKRVCYLAQHCPFWSDDERDDAVQIAWLRDVVEDGKASLEGLRAEGFGSPVIAGVFALSKPQRPLGYAEWVEGLAATSPLIEILVKLADVEDNSDPERLAVLPAVTRERLERKYAGIADLLRNAARAKGWQG